jgi:hypothetical protein
MFPTKNQYRKWSLPTKWSFWAALIGIPLAVVSLGVGFWPLLQPDTSAAQRKELVFKTAHELRYNREFLTNLAQVVRQKTSNLPIGKLSADSLVALTEKYSDLLIKDAYGEQKHLYGLSLHLKHLSERISSFKTLGQLKEFQKKSEWSIDDVLFLNDFLDWYLRDLIAHELEEQQLFSLGFWGFPGDEFRIQGVDSLSLRYFQEDGQPIKKFVDFLGLID